MITNNGCASRRTEFESICRHDFVGQASREHTLNNPAYGKVSLAKTFTLAVDIPTNGFPFESFTGGHIHMVDRFEYRASDDKLIERCFCHYSRQHGKP
jgi:hypothetical protein